VLDTEIKQQAIGYIPAGGPSFGYRDIAVYDNCNATTNSSTSIVTTSTNDTGLDATIVLRGLEKSQVKEIKVFKITA
jgi:hypothetical protein